MLEFLRATYLIDITIQLTLILTYFSLYFYQISGIYIWGFFLKVEHVDQNCAEKTLKKSSKNEDMPLVEFAFTPIFWLLHNTQGPISGT